MVLPYAWLYATVQSSQFLKGNPLESPKTAHYEALFSLFLVKYSVWNLFWCLFVCSFPFQIITYIHTSTHWKATIRSKWTLFCVCSYVCNDPELETAYEQAPKTGFIQNISLGKEKKSFIIFRFWVKARTYDQFQQIVQKLTSITNYECNIKATKTVLTRMDVLKNSNFHYVHDFSQNLFHFKNLYILYSHNFSIE